MVQETDETVEYAYGHPEKDRRMTFCTATRRPTTPMEQMDHGSRAVVWGILRRLNADQRWPKGGIVQH